MAATVPNHAAVIRKSSGRLGPAGRLMSPSHSADMLPQTTSDAVMDFPPHNLEVACMGSPERRLGGCLLDRP